MSDLRLVIGPVVPKEPTFTFSDHEDREILRFQGTVPRFFVDGEETSDVERIGHAFKRWAESQASRWARDGG